MKKLFRDIMNENQDMIIRICKGYFSEEEDQKDLFQEIMINIWRNIKSFRGESKASTWVYRISINSALMLIRQVEKVKKEEAAWNSIPLDFHDEDTDNEKEVKTLYSCINKLPEMDRLIIILVLEGEKYKDIAQHIGISPSNVGVKVNRIKAKLQKLISETNVLKLSKDA